MAKKINKKAMQGLAKINKIFKNKLKMHSNNLHSINFIKRVFFIC